jgi:hypothetical protein
MDLLLHIGTGKTGSSSIQAYLQQNADRLSERGVMLPSSLGEKNHRRLPAIIQSGRATDTFLRSRGILDPAKQDAARARWLSEFRADIAGSTASTCIISSEHLSFLDQKEVAELKSVLDGLFSSIRVLVYLRDPVDYAVSMYDTAIKMGGIPPGPRPAKKDGKTDYKALLKSWVSAFGKDAITVRLFDRRELHQGDILADFAQAAQIDATDFVQIKAANPSMNLLGQALLKQVNRKLPRFAGQGRPNPHRKQIHQTFERYFGQGPKYVPDAALVQSYRTTFAASNEWVRSMFFPERESLFTPRDYPPAQEMGLAAEDLEQIADLITALWKRK